jgi:hypothetical protein
MPANRVPQPYRAQVFLKIGNEVITVVPPEHLVSFTYLDNMASGGDTFEIELFDRDAFIVENKLHRTTDIDMQWGYVGGVMSKPRKCTMLEYEVTSVDGLQGVLLKVTGIDQNTDQGTSEKKRRSFKDVPIHKIAKQIADENGWGAKVGSISKDPSATIEECESATDTNHSTKENPVPKDRHLQNDVSDLHFLKGLEAIAVSKHTQMADFRFGFDAANQLHFRPLRLLDKKQVQRRYIYPDPEGGVISFTPVISSSLMMKLGADTVIGRTRHGITGEEIYIFRDSTSLQIYTVDPKKPNERKEITKDLADGLGPRLSKFKVNPKFLNEFAASQQTASQQAANRSSSETVRNRVAKNNFKSLPQLTASTPETAALEVHAWWVKYLAKFFEAELTVLGDPTLSPTESEFGTDVIDVTFMVKNQEHYTSGLYRAFSVLHNIDANGKYYSKLEMQSADIFQTK